MIGALTGKHDPEPVPAGACRRLVLGAPAGAARRPGDLEGPHLPAAAVPVRHGLVHRRRGRARRGRSRRSRCRPGTGRSPTAWSVGIFHVDELWQALALVPLGAGGAGARHPGAGRARRVYTSYAEVLLGSNVDPPLTAQMSDLRDARSRIIEAADAERRRIERDLHDGAQQRLVALALTLRMAEKRAAEGDPRRAELVRRAGDEAGLALKDLRDLARGIHPAILTNRGLPPRWTTSPARASVPVEVIGRADRAAARPGRGRRLLRRLRVPREHRQARAGDRRHRVGARRRTGALLVTVSDDGVGGAPARRRLGPAGTRGPRGGARREARGRERARGGHARERRAYRSGAGRGGRLGPVLTTASSRAERRATPSAAGAADVRGLRVAPAVLAGARRS